MNCLHLEIFSRYFLQRRTVSTESFSNQILRYAHLEIQPTESRTTAEKQELETLRDDVFEQNFLAFIDGMRTTKDLLVGDMKNTGLGDVFLQELGTPYPNCERGLIWMLYLQTFLEGKRPVPASVEAMQKDLAIFYVRLWRHDINLKSHERRIENDDMQNDLFLRLLFRIEDLRHLSTRARNILANLNIRFVGELTQRRKNDMLRTKQCGKFTLQEYVYELENLGLAFDTVLDQETKTAFEKVIYG